MMERLTEWYDDGKSKGIMVKEAYGEKVLKTLFSEWDEGYLAMCKLKQYEDMEEDEKMFMIPCNVNDRVHTFYESDIEGCLERGMEVEEIIEEMCEERRVTGFDLRNDGLWVLLNGGIFNPDIRIPIEEFGKTVFLTEQEAKEALERMKK